MAVSKSKSGTGKDMKSAAPKNPKAKASGGASSKRSSQGGEQKTTGSKSSK